MKSFKAPPVAPRLGSEFLGTFFLVFTIVSQAHAGSVGGAISVGATLAALVYALGSVSGAHFNPAVTLAIWLSGRRKISTRDALCYAFVQIAAGMGACFVWWLATLTKHPHGQQLSLTPPGPGFGHNENSAAAVEGLYTAALCYVVLNVATAEKIGTAPNANYGLAIGFTVSAAAIAVGPISGCSLNPALSLGLAFVHHSVQGAVPLSHLAYLVAPVIGAAISSIGFWMANGGLFERYEYEREEVVVTGANVDNSILMTLGDSIVLPDDVVAHELRCEIQWKQTAKKGEGDAFVDVDLSCVKFDRRGECQGAVYFGNQNQEPGLKHMGDQVQGVSESEAVILNLTEVKPTIQALIFTAIVYSGQDLKDLQGYTIRLIDTKTQQEFCRFTQDKTPSGCNSIIAATIFRTGNHWAFRAIDEFYKVPINSSYRTLLPSMSNMMNVQLVIAPGSASGRNSPSQSQKAPDSHRTPRPSHN